MVLEHADAIAADGEEEDAEDVIDEEVAVVVSGVSAEERGDEGISPTRGSSVSKEKNGEKDAISGEYPL